MPDSVFIFEHFAVRSDRMVCDLRISHPDFAYADLPVPARARLVPRLLQRFPQLFEHACVNDFGETFGACAAHASMPHLLEHVVIALQAEAELTDSGADFVPLMYVGKTRWTDRDAFRARIEVNYRDDITAFRAFRDAAAIIDSIVLK